MKEDTTNYYVSHFVVDASKKAEYKLIKPTVSYI